MFALAAAVTTDFSVEVISAARAAGAGPDSAQENEYPSKAAGNTQHAVDCRLG
jgi:hypothetical protein